MESYMLTEKQIEYGAIEVRIDGKEVVLTNQQLEELRDTLKPELIIQYGNEKYVIDDKSWGSQLLHVLVHYAEQNDIVIHRIKEGDI